MISAKGSTNSESLSKFGRGRRMGWRNPLDIPKYYHSFLYYVYMMHTKRIIQVSFSLIRYFEVTEDYLSYNLFLVKFSAGMVELME